MCSERQSYLEDEVGNFFLSNMEGVNPKGVTPNTPPHPLANNEVFFNKNTIKAVLYINGGMRVYVL